MTRDEQIEQQLTLLRDGLAKMGSQLDALEALMSSEPTPGQLAKGLVGTFIIEWGKRYPGPAYAVTSWPREIGNFKRLLGKPNNLKADELHRRIERYIRSNDKYYAGEHHPLGLFFQAVNRFADDPPASLLGPRLDDVILDLCARAGINRYNTFEWFTGAVLTDAVAGAPARLIVVDPLKREWIVKHYASELGVPVVAR